MKYLLTDGLMDWVLAPVQSADSWERRKYLLVDISRCLFYQRPGSFRFFVHGLSGLLPRGGIDLCFAADTQGGTLTSGEASEDTGPLVIEGAWGIRSGKEGGKNTKDELYFLHILIKGLP